MESYYVITLNSGHSNSTQPGILLDLIQMINQVHHLDPFAQVGEHYMSIMKQVEKHKRITYWALLHSIMGQNWSIICQGLVAAEKQPYKCNDMI